MKKENLVFIGFCKKRTGVLWSEIKNEKDAQVRSSESKSKSKIKP